jgi:hypothetical protein
VAQWWHDLVAGFRDIRASTRYSARIGRVFGLRDRGRLDEALSSALSIVDDLFASPSAIDRSSVIVVASTIDEIAERLNKPEAAYDALKRALAVIEQAQAELVPGLRPKADDWQSTLESYHRQFRDRINVIVSRRNA